MEQWHIRSKDYPTAGTYGDSIELPISETSKITSIRVKQLHVSFNAFNVIDSNQYLRINPTNVVLGLQEVLVFTIPKKYYSIDTLKAELEAAYNAAAAFSQLHITIDPVTKKVGMRISWGAELSVTFIISTKDTSDSTPILKMLGFPNSGLGSYISPETTSFFWISPVYGNCSITVTTPSGLVNVPIIYPSKPNKIADIFTIAQEKFHAAMPEYILYVEYDNYTYGVTLSMFNRATSAPVVFRFSGAALTIYGGFSDSIPYMPTYGKSSYKADRCAFNLADKVSYYPSDWYSTSSVLYSPYPYDLKQHKRIVVTCDEAYGINTHHIGFTKSPSWLKGMIGSYGIKGPIGTIMSFEEEDHNWVKLKSLSGNKVLHIRIGTDSHRYFGPVINDWFLILEAS